MVSAYLKFTIMRILIYLISLSLRRKCKQWVHNMVNYKITRPQVANATTWGRVNLFVIITDGMTRMSDGL